MSPSSPKNPYDASAPSTPASQRAAYPFPSQDGSPGQSSTSRYQPRRGSNGSITSRSSIGGSLDLQPRRKSSVRETSQNSIAALLQQSTVRTGLPPNPHTTAAATGYKAPTTRDIPPVTLTNIPHVPPETFRDYLNKVGPLFESFQRGRAETEPLQWTKKEKEVEKVDRFAEALERRMSRDGSVSPIAARQNPMSLLSPVETPGGHQRRRSSVQIRRNRNEPTPLSTIPSVYFDEDFNLGNPRTFDVVSERAEIVRPPPGTVNAEQKAANGAPPAPRKALATNAILQEKLSWYMDTVEIHLISSISQASTGFFTALGSLKELQTEAEESVANIQRLRADLNRLDKEVAVGGLEVATMRRRRGNVQKLKSATQQVQAVVDSVKRTDELVDNGSYDEAIDQMDKVARLLCGRPEPGQDDQSNDYIDLRPVKALKGLDVPMQELQYRIGAGYANRFTTTLLADLRQHVERVPHSETLKRWSRQRGVPPTYMETTDQFRQQLRASLIGLSRCGHSGPAVAGFREAAIKEMKLIIRRYLPSSTDDDADSMVSSSTRGGNKLTQQEKSAILARNLRALDSEDAEALFVNIYAAVSEALRRLSTQTKVLLDVTSQMSTTETRRSAEATRSPPRSPGLASIDDKFTNGAMSSKLSVQDDVTQALDISSLLGQAVDTAQTQITRVLKVRNEQTVRLPKSLFMRYFTLNRLFADECEAVSGRGGQTLKGVINAQISSFVQVLGQTETERIANVLDSDAWNAEDFTEDREKLLQRILGAMNKDPPEWTSSTPIWESASMESIQSEDKETTSATDRVAPTSNGNATATGKAATRAAYIDDNRYVLVLSAASLLSTIDTFLSLTATLPTMTQQISTSLLDVMRTFNSRSCQLILGAGATRSAGLKNITTKHLALASQALSFVIALVPYIRESVRRHLPAGQQGTLAEFDKTKRLYQEHQAGIHDKLVEIMTTRSQSHVKAMSAIDFDEKEADPDKASPYMETLTKETLTLHRVLSRHLPELDVNIIMRQIASAYREQWTKAFGSVEVKTEGGEKRVRRDAEAFEARLGKIDGFAQVGKELKTIVDAGMDTGDRDAAKTGEEAKQEERK